MRQLRALLWKEWRQMMPLFVACAIGCVVSLGLARIAEITQRQPSGELVSLAALVFCAFVVALFPSAIVAGERRTGGLTFLRNLPVSPARLLLAKLLIVLALCGALLIWTVLVASLLKGALLVPITFNLVAAAGLALLLICGCLFASSGVRHPIVAFIIGPAIVLMLIAASSLLLPYSALLSRWASIRPAWLGGVLIAALCIIPSLLLVALAWRLLARRAPEPRSAWAAGWVITRPLLLLLVVMLLVHGVCLVYDALTLAPKPDEMFNLESSPDGRFLAFGCGLDSLRGTATGIRTGILDADSGKATLLTRFNSSWPSWQPGWQSKGYWSPDGRFVALTVSRDWWLPGGIWGWSDSSPLQRFVMRHSSLAQGRSFLYDARSANGARFLIPSFHGAWWPKPDKLFGWVWNVKSMRMQLLRYDVAGQRTTPVTMPVGLRAYPAEYAWDQPWAAFSGRTVYVYRSATDDWVNYVVPPNDSVFTTSRDGWFVVFANSGATEVHPKNDERASECYVGRVLLINPLRKSSVTLVERAWFLQTGQQPVSRWWQGGFSPDGRHLLYRVPDENDKTKGIWIYDLETGHQEMVAVPQMPASAYLRFSPSGSRVAWTMSSGKGELTQWVLDIASRTAKPALTFSAGRRYAMNEWLGENYLLVCSLEERLAKDGNWFPPRIAILRVRWDGTGWEEIFPKHRKLTAEDVAVMIGSQGPTKSDRTTVQP